MKLYDNTRVNKDEKSNSSQEIQSEHRNDSDFYLISVKPMKSYRHPNHVTIFRFLVLESYEILVSELNEIQCNVATDSIGDSKE